MSLEISATRYFVTFWIKVVEVFSWTLLQFCSWLCISKACKVFMIVMYTGFCDSPPPPVQDGGFYSAEDADSFPTAGSEHKKEGAFCVWTKEEIVATLVDPLPNDTSKTLADLFSFHYDVQEDGNVNPHQVCMRDLTIADYCTQELIEVVIAPWFKQDLIYCT